MSEHSFNGHNSRSHRHERTPEIQAILKRLFPDAEFMRLEKRLQHQRIGIDAHILMKDGSLIRLDHKFREEIWIDFLLEFMSNAERNVSGWVADSTLVCDYFAYWFLPLFECHLLPRVGLQSAWQNNGKAWIKQFGIISARSCDGNDTWTTLSCPVPLWTVFEAVPGVRTARRA